MALLPNRDEMYRAVKEKDTSYEGVFFVAVKTTGILCRPGCPARTPKPENIEYFATPREALAAGYRPCRRCHPLEPANETPRWVRNLLERIDEDPSRRWKDQDLREIGLDPSTVRRWFTKHHGMTFHAYARARRLANALGAIRAGDDATGVAFDHGYESLSGFREAFGKLFQATPGAVEGKRIVTVSRLTTPLGPMLIAVSDEGLCLLEFVDRRMLERQIQRVAKYSGAAFVPGTHELIEQTAGELAEYFKGERKELTIPIDAPGSDFQEKVWSALKTIPYGETWSYQQLAKAIGSDGAARAVGRANGDNRIAILIPCHRVVRADGDLGGYGGQKWRKRWLLNLEAR